MKTFFIKNLYKLLLNKIYNPFVSTNIKPLPLEIYEDTKCLVIAPHPDDESIGCGGIMKLYPKHFDVISLTHGDDTRAEEMKEAMDFAGINNLKMYNLKDKHIIDGQEEFNKIDISDYDIIFIPYIFDQHKDHKAVSILLDKHLNTAKHKSNLQIAYYEVWSTINMPQYYMNISSVTEDKKKMINFHKSQILTKDYANKIIGLNSYRGLLKSLDAVEAFSLMDVKSFHNIVSKLVDDI